jgi:hypothetical protein
VQALGVAAGRSELLPQLMVLRAQALAKRDELGDLRFKRIELRLHGANYLSKLMLRQAVRLGFACVS